MESINERSINKIQAEWSKINDEWAKITTEMARRAAEWKAAAEEDKASHLQVLKKLTADKNALLVKKDSLEKELDDAISGKDKDLELIIKESEVNEGVGTIALGVMLAWVGLKVIGAVAKQVLGKIGANVELPAEKLKQVTDDMVSRAAKETGSGKMLLLGTFLKIDLDKKIDSGEIKTVSALEKAMEEYLSTNESVVNESAVNESIVNEVSKRATDFYGDSKYGSDIHSLLNGKWDSNKVENYLEKLGGGNDTKYARIIDFISGDAGLNIRKYKNIGEQLPDLMKQLEILYKDFLTESLEEGVNMEELEDTLKRVKKENPGKKVSYFFTKDSAKGYMISIDGKQIKESEDLDESVTNEARHIMVKRQYTENHPAVTVGKSAKIRNRMLEAIADGKLTRKEFDTILREMSVDSKRWVSRNTKYFNLSEDGIALSKYGKSVLRQTINEDSIIYESFDSFLATLQSEDTNEI